MVKINKFTLGVFIDDEVMSHLLKSVETEIEGEIGFIFVFLLELCYHFEKGSV